jgi:hypothetical protein
MDGVPTGYSTPYTFTGLTGTHTFTVPSTNSVGHPFSDWNTGSTGTTITVSSAGVYTARYKGIAITGITGEVNCDRLPLADVELRQGATVIDSTVSDSEGNYLLTAPAPGTYDVVVDKDGWRPQTQQVTVSGTGTIIMDFIGQTGLIPNDPSVQYVAQCSNHYLYPYSNCGLTVQKVAAVSNAYLYPVSE